MSVSICKDDSARMTGLYKTVKRRRTSWRSNKTRSRWVNSDNVFGVFCLCRPTYHSVALSGRRDDNGVRIRFRQNNRL